MNSAPALQEAKAAQERMLTTQTQFRHDRAARDVAVIAARAGGASVIEIASELHLSRQQVHKIVTKEAPHGQKPS